MELTDFVSDYGLEYLGLHNLGPVWWNTPTPALIEQAIRRFEGHLSHQGPLVVTTGTHTGRSPRDRYVVEDETHKGNVWWGKVNVSYPEEKFNKVLEYMSHYLYGKTLYVQDLHVGADERYRHNVRVITTHAWHALFARNMFLTPERDPEKVRKLEPEFTVLQCPSLHVDPDVHGTRSGTFVGLNLERKLILICGSHYGGEIKKSIFSALNYFYPAEKVLPMHCSANISKTDPDNVAIFFGLSGTGKTTLSSDVKRLLIGDDEHGWSDDGVFNFEGGCYAKVIRLSAEAEPDIYECTRRFGTILENVIMDQGTRLIDLDDDTLTENTRASYPITHIPLIQDDGKGKHPKNVIMLTCDAFGVLPPISKLTPEQAMYHFISGYTAKVAGTEVGITEPQATFSTCFGAPFMVRHPSVYAEMLAERLKRTGADCWLVNTGWSGGPHGVGSRMKIQLTRALLNAALDGSLADVPYEEDPVFAFQVPTQAPDVPTEILKPRNTWDDKDKFDETAKKLARMFADNFKQFEEGASDAIKKAGPRVD